MASSVKITVLVENRSSRNDLDVEHGLSLWIEADGLRVLFDTGQSGAFLLNAQRLGMTLSGADALVLSHGHYDHAGGLACLSGRGEPKRLYLHPEAVTPRYSRQQHPPHRAIGMPSESAALVDRLRSRVVWTTTPALLSERIGITGPIPRATDFEDAGGPFFLDPECTRPDTIADDQAVWIQTGNGIAVVLGCAHAGVVNTLEHVARLTGARRFCAVLGGLHLHNADEHRLARTADALKRYGVQRLALGHCTGDAAVEYLAGHCPGSTVPFSTGTTLDL